jgi:ubiquinone/menaquinone biosynthesis C-methylase UbiE
MEFAKLATHYTGGTAQGYEAERTVGPEWPREQAIADEFLSRLTAGATIVDIPVGTGRFLEFYKKHELRPTGLDISLDMLAEAKGKAAALNLDATLIEGDIRKIAAPDKSFDAALCVRFVNWVDFAGFEAALTELSRVARSTVILSVRVWPAPKTFGQWLHKSWITFRRRRADLNFHNEEATLALFARLGFAVADSQTVRTRKDRTRYMFYYLRRTT